MTAGAGHSLYGAPLSPFSMRVVMQIRLKRLAIPLVPPPGGVHSEDYRAIAPTGKIPALGLPGGRVIGESAVIADYLEEAFPETPLLPADAAARAEARLTARIADIYVTNRMLPIFGELAPATRDAAKVESVIADIAQGFSWLEQHLRAAAPGYDASYAACALAPILFYVDRFLPMFGKADPLAGYPLALALYCAATVEGVGASVVADMDTALSELGL